MKSLSPRKRDHDLTALPFEGLGITRIALAPPGVDQPIYATYRRTNYQFTDADRPDDVLSFPEWQGHPGRSAIRLEEDDRAALGQLIALIARPQRPDVGLKYLQGYANWRVIQDTGAPHPDFVGKPRKKNSEVMNNLASLDRFFRQALRAGSALEASWTACEHPKQFGERLSVEAKDVFNLSLHHGDRLAPQSDERKKLWSNYLPIIHLAMTMRQSLIAAGLDTDNCAWKDGDVLKNILEANIPSSWMSHFLVEAERWSYRMYYQQLIPEPERMLRLILRPRELSR